MTSGEDDWYIILYINSSCVALQDPYCSWEVDNPRCINLIGPDDINTR